MEKRSKRRNKVQDYAEAIRQARGLLSYAADALGVTRQALYLYVDAHPELHDVINEARERTLDLAENNILTKLDTGDYNASQFILSRLGRNRGYGEKVEQSGSVEIVFRHVRANGPSDD